MSSTTGGISKKSAVTIVMVALVFASGAVFFASVQSAQAFPWGGQFQRVISCFNSVIWVQAGPPRGGKYIWVPGATQTFDYGKPARAGQWGIGLAAPPYFCIVSPLPLIVFPGVIMTMLGTSR